MNPRIFNVPAVNMPELKKKLEKLNKKGRRAGTGEIKLIVISKVAEKVGDGTVNVIYQVAIEGEAPKIAGWTFVARLDHNVDQDGTRNLVYVMPGQKLPEEMRNNPAECEHCGYHRRRKDTYILQHDDGSYKQVGRTCIQDFIGHDPEKVAAHAERIVKLHNFCKDAEKEPSEQILRDRRFIQTDIYLAHVAMAIREHGWVSGAQAYNDWSKSTRSRALDTMFPPHSYLVNTDGYKPSEEDYAMANAAIKWALQQDKTKDDFTHNMVTIVQEGYLDWKATGIAAAIVRLYQRHVEKIEANKSKFDLSKSEHFAEVGSRITGKVKVISSKVINGYYGATTLVRMVAVNTGNLLVTFSTGQFCPEVGDELTISGTVKKNDVYNGIKQTMLSRVRVKKEVA